MFEANITPRCLLGPGPSNVHPRVMQALGYPTIGHMDPQFLNLMNSTHEMLRYVFQTENDLALAVAGTGSAGMEAAVCNFLEAGDPVLVCVNGYFGERIYEMTTRYWLDVTRLERPWGEVFSPEEIQAALNKKQAKVVAIVHGETSTGAMQPMQGIAEIVHAQGGLLLTDFVASLGGTPVYVDQWGVDIAYSGSQKCLSVPPGLAPITISQRALDVLSARKSKVANWYLDLSMIRKYWGKERVYHHTAPINMNYALHEGLLMVKEEGLETRWARHMANAEYLWAGLEGLGMKLVMPRELRMPMLTTVFVPQGVDELAIRRKLLNDYNIEIAGGLGVFAGKIWRIGLMGHSSQRSNVTLLLGALKELL
jgi:alanine-glyoxylate transaminase / serine-glyoxylate transaminase / serine-pyruvate transaminase